MSKLRFLLILIPFVCGCKLILPASKRYRITVDGIEGRTSGKHTLLSISKFQRDDVAQGDIRPKSYKETRRFNFWLKEGCEGSSSIFFDEDNAQYKSFPEVSKASPLEIEHGFVYQVFGLCDVDGSYYFCLDSLTNRLIVQYQDAGPW